LAVTAKTKQRGAVSTTGVVGLAIIAFVALSGLVVIGQEVNQAASGELGVNHSECLLFTPAGGEFRMQLRDRYSASTRTQQVTAQLAKAAGRIRTSRAVSEDVTYTNTIDREIFGALKAAEVAPAARTTDLEFIRRVTLDLTGRVPKAARVTEFVNNANPDKRAVLVDELMVSPEYVDKWTMFFGDLFKNNLVNQQIARFAEGRDGFYRWIKAAVETNKPYNRMATELIAATGTNSFEQGELGWLVGGYVTGSPSGGQDIYDQQAANVAETFLGISHENCILCHDGRRHLDALSVWGKQETRYEAWQLAAFFAKTTMPRVSAPTTNSPNAAYFGLIDNPRLPDYPLNTTTGNRPRRAPIASIANVTPAYPFTGEKPAPNENYRVALARFLTADPQFSRAIVNLLWKELFGRGIIDPVNQVDLMRLEPSTLPPPNEDAPRLSTLQPSHPALLNTLATEFQAEGFGIKQLLRKMVLSEAYQLSSRYEGEWKAEYEPLFARKYVRRLWGEEIIDALIQISNVPLTLAVTVNAAQNVAWAMQLPEPTSLPRAAATASFLDSFLRGNRDTEDRRGDGNIAQVLNLMNDTIVYSRARASGSGATASFGRQLLDRHALPAANNALVHEMFLTVLSREPDASELDIALKRLGTLTGTARQQAVEDLLWALYNKVDFLYNY
jgi:Protein of unknown function (DUF1549)/Protein of unknown function (DUF1553)